MNPLFKKFQVKLKTDIKIYLTTRTQDVWRYFRKYATSCGYKSSGGRRIGDFRKQPKPAHTISVIQVRRHVVWEGDQLKETKIYGNFKYYV